MSFTSQPFRPNIIEKIQIAPKVSFGSQNSNYQYNNMLPLQTEKKRLFDSSNILFNSSGLNQNEMSNLRILGNEIRTYNTTFLQNTQRKSMEETFNKFKNQMCLSSTLEPNDLQYFLDMSFENYLDLSKNKRDILDKFIRQCQYELLSNIEYKTVNQSEIKNIEEFARTSMERAKNSNYNTSSYSGYNINNS